MSNVIYVKLITNIRSFEFRITYFNPGEENKASALKVVHKHGPCSELNQIHKENTPNHTQILDRDQARVKSIHSRLGSKKMNSDDATTMPVNSGDIVSSGDYIVTVGLGTPQQKLSLIFDTGSDLSWTQCRPCIGSCYKQMESLFDPSISTSYVNISCKSNVCSQLTRVTQKIPRCSTDNSTCMYDMQYGDKSFSVGFFGKESLTLTSTEVFDEFLFGCGQTNQGNFGSSAGFLGLGRHNISFVQQTANKYGRIFSYCLPSTSSSTGYLGFGKDRRASKHVKFTPLTTVSQNPSFYGLNLVGISVGGRKLWISPSVFLSSGTIIDTGTVITRLPVAAYSALRDVFRQAMTKYPLTQALSVLDTCYDLSSYVTVKYPHIAFYFQGGLKLKLDATGIFYSSSASQVCLAFAGNDANNKFAVLGNVQQKTFEVVYDVAGGRVGFASGGCL